MTLKPIRSAEDHKRAESEATALMAKRDQQSLDRLEILQALIERWERNQFVFPAASPADAIKFRMAQLELQPRDLIPYVGTKSRVSEILSGQRQPTVDQIRALNKHLGIPAESLIGETRLEPVRKASSASKAAIHKLRQLNVMKPRETVDTFMTRILKGAPALAMLRKSRTGRTNAKTDLAALEAWCAAVLAKAEERSITKRKREALDGEFARKIAQVSRVDDWLNKLHDELAKAGVILILLDHLPGTYLDGAAICRGDGAPVIALTLRHDRLDNFWFTLLHELAHVILHLGDGTTIIVDDLDVNNSEGIEAEADAFAREALIPSELWTKYDAPDLSTEALHELAAEAKVHPAVAAGRWRFAHKDYRRFSRLLGQGLVREQASSLKPSGSAARQGQKS